MEKTNPIQSRRTAHWAFDNPWAINKNGGTPSISKITPTVAPSQGGNTNSSSKSGGILDSIFSGITGVGNLVSSHILGQQQIESNARNMQELAKYGYLNQGINPGSPLAGLVGSAYPQQYQQIQEQSNTRRLLIFGGIAILTVLLIAKFAKK